jgi:hypothetical protein
VCLEHGLRLTLLLPWYTAAPRVFESDVSNTDEERVASTVQRMASDLARLQVCMHSENAESP